MARLIWGRQPVLEILRSPRAVKRLILRQGVRGEGILKIRMEAANQSITIEELPPKVFDKLVGNRPAQGVLLELAGEQEYSYSLDDILQTAQTIKEPPFGRVYSIEFIKIDSSLLPKLIWNTCPIGTPSGSHLL